MSKKFAVRFNILIFLALLGIIFIFGSQGTFFADYSSNPIGATTGIRYEGVTTLVIMGISGIGILIQFFFFIKYIFSYIQPTK